MNCMSKIQEHRSECRKSGTYRSETASPTQTLAARNAVPEKQALKKDCRKPTGKKEYTNSNFLKNGAKQC